MSWHSEAAGDIGIGPVTGVEPFEAITLPLGAGKIADVLIFPFVTLEGRKLIHAARDIMYSRRGYQWSLCK
jgi:hypothetical protein